MEELYKHEKQIVMENNKNILFKEYSCFNFKSVYAIIINIMMFIFRQILAIFDRQLHAVSPVSRLAANNLSHVYRFTQTFSPQ